MEMMAHIEKGWGVVVERERRMRALMEREEDVQKDAKIRGENENLE